jgi:hypothetical protein
MSSCAICLDEDANKEFYVTDCNHVFHKECLLQTKGINKNVLIQKSEFTILNCPLCRQKLSIYNLNLKTFCSEVLDCEIFSQIKSVYKHVKNLHLNQECVFISGGYATALYSKLTNKNTIFDFTDIDIYYIDYHNLYTKNSKNIYRNSCKTHINNIKDVQKGNFVFNKESHTNKLYDIIFLESEDSHGISYNSNILESSILKTFKGFDLSCCKVAFTIVDDYIKFYIHSDYYRKSVNICEFSSVKTEQRIIKYQYRGYEFNTSNYTKCCHYEYMY